MQHGTVSLVYQVVESPSFIVCLVTVAQSAPAPFFNGGETPGLVQTGWVSEHPGPRARHFFHTRVPLFHLATGVQRLVAQEEASGGEGRGHRVSRHAGGGEDGGAAEGDVGAATAAGQGAFGSNADGGAGEATGGAAVKEALLWECWLPCRMFWLEPVFIKRSQRPFSANEPFFDSGHRSKVTAGRVDRSARLKACC